jgi:hypothetical protein
MSPRSALAWTSCTFALLIVLLLASGCGGGGHAEVFAGTLEVHNSIQSFEYIVDIEVADVFSSYDVVFFDQDVFPGESWFLDLHPSEYDVWLYWSDFTVDAYRVEIFDDFTTTIVAFN